MDCYRSEQKLSAIDAMAQAQRLAFAPIAFQAARLLCKFKILDIIEQAGEAGASLETVVSASEVSEYGADVLLSMGLSAGLVYKNTDENFVLTKTGFFLVNDEMTRINMAFTHDVCYQAMFHLEESIREEKPAGLQVFGEWDTLYQGLTKLPEPARTSWYDFDHYYSDGAFDRALDIVFKDYPKTLFDIGGNTGKWSLACARHDKNVKVRLHDLPQQLEIAQQRINDAGVADRVSCVPVDMLDEQTALQGPADAIWMSQFLDCFSPEQIVSILRKAKAAMHAGSKLFIMETLWDTQKFEAASYSLNATSLYFTAIANGNSRMYAEEPFRKLIEEAGLAVVERVDNVGLYHSIFVCQRSGDEQQVAQ